MVASNVVYSISRFEEPSYKLADFLDTDTVSMNREEIVLITSLHNVAALLSPRIEIAIVVGSTTSNPDSVSLLHLLFSGSSWDIQIFPSLKAANNWPGSYI